MANTTNFNWETPDDTDLVKDGAAAIRTLAGAIDTSLVDLKGGTSGQVLSKATNTDMDFTWVTSDDANAIQNAIVDAKGDIVAASANDTPARLAVGTNDQRLVAASGEATGLKYVSDTQNTVIDAEGDLLVGDAADAVQRLAVGTTGQVLTVDTTVDGKIKWAAPAGGGKVLQVVQGTLTGIASRNATSFGDTGITVSITPSSATSTVLVLGNVSGATKAVGNSGAKLALQLVRTSTAILDMSDSNGYTGSSLDNVVGTVGFTYLDSPATTSATTYKIQFASGVSGQNVYINDYRDASDTTVSTIVVMEIGA
jgi:hypothetical protein